LFEAVPVPMLDLFLSDQLCLEPLLLALDVLVYHHRTLHKMKIIALRKVWLTNCGLGEIGQKIKFIKIN